MAVHLLLGRGIAAVFCRPLVRRIALLFARILSRILRCHEMTAGFSTFIQGDAALHSRARDECGCDYRSQQYSIADSLVQSHWMPSGGTLRLVFVFIDRGLIAHK